MIYFEKRKKYNIIYLHYWISFSYIIMEIIMYTMNMLPIFLTFNKSIIKLNIKLY